MNAYTKSKNALHKQHKFLHSGLSHHFDRLARKSSLAQFRSLGVMQFTLEPPSDAVEIKIEATFSHEEAGEAEAEMRAVYVGSHEAIIGITSSTK